MKQHVYQQGFLILYLLIILAITASSGLIFLKPSAEKLRFHQQKQQIDLLNTARSHLLSYTTNIPEIYATNTSSAYFANDRVPSPGYLPCPDTDKTGAMNTPCGQGLNFVGGRLPNEINSRHIRFNPSDKVTIHYVVDSRYVIQNSDYNNPPTQRFAPLNNLNPGNGFLSLEGHSDVIAFIFLSSNTYEDYIEDAVNGVFKRPELAVTISHQDWTAHTQQRIAAQINSLCTIPIHRAHWFNACNNYVNPSLNCHFDPYREDNPVGANWRDIFPCP